VRRLVVLFVVALVGATVYGLSGLSSGLSVNHQHVNGDTFRSELSAIEQHPTLACYLDALDPTSYASGAGHGSIAAAGAAAWANLRVEGLAINQYVTTTLKFVPNAAQLTAAKASLVSELRDAAASRSITCTGTAKEALSEMPAEMRTAEIEDQATSLHLVAKLKSAIPLTAASIKNYYDQHTTSYDTLCVSIALVLPTDVTAFAKSQSAGLSIAQLAEKYSKDPSATKGGAYGCYAPSSSSYASVRSDVGTTAIDAFPAQPQFIEYNSAEYALYVGVTSRTVTPFKDAKAAVLSDLRTLNAESANTVKNDVLYKAAVHVDPAFGQWTLSTAGLEVIAPATLLTKNVLGVKKLTPSAARVK
jgi:hypothetical protein